MQNTGISEIARQLAENLSMEKDLLLRTAISKRMNNENWTVEDVADRIVKVENIGPFGGEIFLMDGVPILEILPSSPEVCFDIASGIEEKNITYKIAYRMA